MGDGNGYPSVDKALRATSAFHVGVEEAENAETIAKERDTSLAEPAHFPCPDILWQGRFAQVADRLNRRSWEIWLGTLCAMGAVAHKNLHWHYYRSLYGMVYGLLISPTGQGKGIVADVCHALLPEQYTMRDSVQSGPALFPILAHIVKDEKGKLVSITPRPAILVVEEWTSLVKASKIEFSQLQETLNNLFHRSRAWNVSRSDTERSGGDREIGNPTLSICATTTSSLLQEGVTPAMIRSGFLNRYFVIPGSSDVWRFYDPDQAGIDASLVKGFLDDLVANAWGNGANVWTAYMDDARERLVLWGEQLFTPLMASQSIEAESLKRLHVYAHIICLLYAWSERAPRVLSRHVEAAIYVCTVSKVFVEGLMASEEVEVPKFKKYEMGLEHKIMEKVKREPGVTVRKVCQDLRVTGSCRDIIETSHRLAKNGDLVLKRKGKSESLYFQEETSQ